MGFSPKASVPCTLVSKTNRGSGPGGVPDSPAGLSRSQRQLLSYAANGVQSRIPTAHIFGQDDIEYPEFGPVLRDLCEPEESTVFVHDRGHEVAGVEDKKVYLGQSGT